FRFIQSNSLHLWAMTEYRFCGYPDEVPLSEEILEDTALLASQRISHVELMEDTFTKKKSTIITTKISLNTFDAFHPKGISAIKYYVRKFVKFTDRGLKQY